MQQPNNLFPFGSVLGNPFLFNGDLSDSGFESSRVFFLLPFLLSQGGAMDLSKVGEKFLSSVKSARSLGLLPPSPSDRPEVPARVAAAAAVARALAGLPPHQRFNLSSSSTELSSIYGARPTGDIVPELEDEFHEEEFDPVRYILEQTPDDETELAYFEKQAALRLSQLDLVSERLSQNVMQHREVMVKGMDLVRELERDLKVANVICKNGRRHLNSSMNEVSSDLIVNSNSKKKQALSDVLPVLAELLHAMDMQNALECLVEEGDFCKAFQVLSEYLQLLDGLSELSAIKEMGRGVEIWLGKTLQRLDSLLLGVCQEFKEQNYLTVIDAYALIGDVSGLAEKIQSFYMQEVLSETHVVLRIVVLEDQGLAHQNSRLTYSDLCHQIQESKFRKCLLQTLAVIFKLMCSYYEIMSFQLENEDSAGLQPSSFEPLKSDGDKSESVDQIQNMMKASEDSADNSSHIDSSGDDTGYITRDNGSAASASGSPWYHLRKDATDYVSQTLQRGRKNLWQLTTSRVSVLLSSAVVSSTSIHQFLRIYEDLNVFVLAGESFCGIEATEFRNKLKAVCEGYFASFHRQNIYALKMVLEKENWMRLPSETSSIVSFAGLVGDGAALIVPSGITSRDHSEKSQNSIQAGSRKSGFAYWLRSGNIFLHKLTGTPRECHSPSPFNGRGHDGTIADHLHDYKYSPKTSDSNRSNGYFPSEEENEDLLADFIDEDSQLPSRISKPNIPKRNPHMNDQDSMAQTGSSLSLLRSMDKYARLMQKLEIVNVEFFKGMCQLFEIFFYFVYETFGPPPNSTAKGLNDFQNYRLRSAMSRITQDCDQWLKPHSPAPSSSAASLNDVTPTSPTTSFAQLSTSLGLKERCTGADTVSLVARILLKSKAHLQSMLLQNNSIIVDDFYANMVDAIPDLIEHIHRTTARQLLHISGYADRIAAAKWEVKELGLEHNGYVDLMLGEFKHYKTRLMHGGISKEIQDVLLDYGLDIVAETLTEGLSRVKRCTDEGRALMSLDLQVLINGLQHFVSANVRPKFQIVDAFIKAYYLPETEYVHWARGHPEYTKSQVVGLINLVSTMKGWKRKTRLEVLEKIE